ncbi:hypothetical protein AArcCO_0723 [Halalkaliarchaeum sp. AArc-CO]|uniref:hypothetical protein n=1 Tax=unclassified Halalkaliarchaeum TaxID=2678344 RepID=UPI00217E29E7|nr:MULTISPECIES: hypothetical protein [unclassified Halalkaliarchaeum]MDR5672336.1 hypothetical protein [Halalkaliarchaeum sp. AArc-GB]UWG50044.1 hypothetical protein AArcCO_0723 [Halalkaliarchaeum sp. AArc-CO]
MTSPNAFRADGAPWKRTCTEHERTEHERTEHERILEESARTVLGKTRPVSTPGSKR